MSMYLIFESQVLKESFEFASCLQFSIIAQSTTVMNEKMKDLI